MTSDAREPNGVVQAIETWKPSQIARWLHGWLVGDGAIPRLDLPASEDVADALLRSLDGAVSEQIRRTLSLAVGDLVNRWSRRTASSLEYLTELLMLIAAFDLNVPRPILSYIISSYLKGKESRWGDMHLLALKAALPYHRYDRMLEPVLQGDIREPPYTAVCFKGLYGIDPNNGEKYLGLVLELAASNPATVCADPILFDLGRTVRSPALVHALKSVSHHVSKAARCAMLDALEANPFVIIVAPEMEGRSQGDLLITVPGATEADPYFVMRDDRLDLGSEQFIITRQAFAFASEVGKARVSLFGSE